MSPFDFAIIAIIAGYALAGFWNGLLPSVASMLGMLGGLALGAVVAPLLLFGADPGPWVSVFTVVLVVGIGATVQGLVTHAANRTRDRVSSDGLRLADAGGGAVVNGLGAGALVVLLAGAMVNIPHEGISGVIRESSVVSAAEKWTPSGLDTVASKFADVVDSTGVSVHADPFIPDTAPAVEAPDPSVVKAGGVRRAAKSVLRVIGVNECGVGVEGTAFVYAKNRLMTNAHVVAGIERPEVLTPWGPVQAKVVFFDDELDIAVLAADTRKVEPLVFEETGEAGDQFVALGYPAAGPFHTAPVRVRDTQRLRSGDLHDEGTVIRDVLVLRGVVRPGNSGGPLVSESGTVSGVVFATSTTGFEVGYAMTAAQVADAAAAGVAATGRVDTGGCIG
mgnify:CR=1 FL=1